MNTHTQRTYDQVFQHPMTHNLEWRDVRSLFEALGEVEEEHNGNLKVTVAGRSVVFHAYNGSDVASADQVSQIRHFLQDAKERDAAEPKHHLLVVIDHNEAKIYQAEMKGTVPETISPQDLEGYKGHVHSAHDFNNHNETPDYHAYFTEIAARLKNAEKILIFGSGSGSSAAMDIFVAWLKEHEANISEQIIGAVTIDQGHLTEGQLLAKAREIYSA